MYLNYRVICVCFVSFTQVFLFLNILWQAGTTWPFTDFVSDSRHNMFSVYHMWVSRPFSRHIYWSWMLSEFICVCSDVWRFTHDKLPRFFFFWKYNLLSVLSESFVQMIWLVALTLVSPLTVFAAVKYLLAIYRVPADRDQMLSRLIHCPASDVLLAHLQTCTQVYLSNQTFAWWASLLRFICFTN